MALLTTSNDELKRLPLPQQLLYWAQQRPGEVALRQKEFGVWEPVTWAQYAQQSRWFGLGLIKPDARIYHHLLERFGLDRKTLEGAIREGRKGSKVEDEKAEENE